MAWKDLRDIKEVPLGMALGTVSKMITGQNMNIKPRQLKKLQDEKLEEFQTRQEEEREKLFMIFANHFTAPEDVVEAREDFWGLINHIYGTHTFRTYVDSILSQPDVVEGIISLYFDNEEKLQDLTYQLDRRTNNVKAFGDAVETAPKQLAELLENYDGNAEAFIEQLATLEPDRALAPVQEEQVEDDAETEVAETAEEATAGGETENTTEEIKEAV